MPRSERPTQTSASSLGGIVTVAGLLGGGALVAAEALSSVGPLIVLPYTVLVLGTAFLLQRRGESRFGVRFGAVLAAFMLATLLLYAYIGAVETSALRTISPWGHAWRLGLMLGIGALAGTVAAFLSSDRGASSRSSVIPGTPAA